MEREPITRAFHRYFDISELQGQEALEAAFRLRYEVYCREFQFEREEDCPGQMETDTYDEQAWHCLLEHAPSATPAGCVRVVHVDADDPLAVLPMEHHCRESLHDTAWRPDRLEREQICEVSRLAVHGLFRRRPGEAATPLGGIHALNLSPDQIRIFPILAVSLFIAATVVCVRQRKQHAFAMMEPALARILRRTGLEFTQIGETMHYHGYRAAFYIDADEARASLLRSPALAELYSHVETMLSAGTDRGFRADPSVQHPNEGLGQA